MLLQITNNCLEGCKHCLQDSSPLGDHMPSRIIDASVEWVLHAGFNVVIVSGGEPTLSPFFYYACYALESHGINFIVASNGTWCENPNIIGWVNTVLSMEHCVYMQIYSHPKWYKDYGLIMSHKETTFKHPKIHIVTDDIVSMQDLGRAKHHAQEEVANNKHAMSCLKSTVLARQCKSIQQFALLGSQKVICTPMVDYKGNVHMSESCLCPSCGNVLDDSFETIWSKMHTLNPCMRCKVSQNFKNSGSLNAAIAAKILNWNG